MIVRVFRCWSGGDNFYWRLYLGDGRQYAFGEHEGGDGWNRHFASLALDLLVAETGKARRSIRFHVV